MTEDLFVFKVAVLTDLNVFVVVELNLEIRGKEIALVLESDNGGATAKRSIRNDS